MTAPLLPHLRSWRYVYWRGTPRFGTVSSGNWDRRWFWRKVQLRGAR